MAGRCGEGLGGCSVDLGLPFGVMEMFWNIRWWSLSTMSVLIATELFTLTWLILRYVNFASIKKPIYKVFIRLRGWLSQKSV